MIESICPSLNLPPVKSDYVAKGSMHENTPAGKMYLTGVVGQKRGVVILYDIFAYSNQGKQFADLLAEHGNCRVAIPDLLKGGAPGGYPPKDREQMRAWAAENGSWEKVAPMLLATHEFLKREGCLVVGLVGFCWGGKAAITAAGLKDFFGAAVLIHPSRIEVADCEKANAPLLLLPSKDEADMLPCLEVLKKKPACVASAHHRFDDMPHGFCGTRGDFSNPLNIQRTTEAIKLTIDFFNRTLSHHA